jgi:hypothetical protein
MIKLRLKGEPLNNPVSESNLGKYAFGDISGVWIVAGTR